jgi:metallo-beta-lactamase family protein
MRWLSHLKQPPQRVFLTHGDEEAAVSFAELVQQKLGWPVTLPHYQDTVELTPGASP